MCHICTQYLNCIEALMYYVIHTKDRIAEALTDIFRLFDHHKESNEAIKVITSIYPTPLQFRNAYNYQIYNFRNRMPWLENQLRKRLKQIHHKRLKT